jgi:hypothetical protein
MNAVLAVVRALTWRHWAWAIGLGTVLGSLVVLQTLHINPHVLHRRLFDNTPWYIAAASLFMVAAVWAEATCRSPTGPRLRRYALGALVASGVWIALIYATRDVHREPSRRIVAGDESPQVRNYRGFPKSAVVLTIGFEALVHGWLATLIYVRLRSMRLAAQRLAQAEMERAVASRDLLAAQLSATQGEIDPQGLLDALDAIEDAYPLDPMGADARLEALIVHLRAAIPRVRTREEGLASHAAKSAAR